MKNDIQSAKIGNNTKIWQFTVILPDAEIGSDCNICSHCFIENEVKIGNRVTIKNFNSIWDGITIEDDVFVGPNVCFTNDKYPVSNRANNRKFLPQKTIVKKQTSIGAGSIILPGLIIGSNVIIGAGSMITKNVPNNSKIIGKY